jgi:hypothetical protein
MFGMKMKKKIKIMSSLIGRNPTLVLSIVDHLAKLPVDESVMRAIFSTVTSGHTSFLGKRPLVDLNTCLLVIKVIHREWDLDNLKKSLTERNVRIRDAWTRRFCERYLSG